MQALRVIENEHRSLAAVLHGMLHMVREIREHGAMPSFETFGAMVYYIDAFPEHFHHPKEDRYLFRLLRKRCPQAGALLDQLEEQHRIGAQKIRALEQALTRYQNGGDDEFPRFAAAVDDYAEFHWKHMSDEENEILRIAPTARLAAEHADSLKLQEARELARKPSVTTFRLSYARAAEMAPLVKRFLSPRGEVVYDARTNTLIVID